MPDLDRRRFLGAAAATVAASQLALLTLSRRMEGMTGTLTDAAPRTGSSTDIRPFHVSFPEADLADLRRRIRATRWPEKETVNDETQGVQFATTQKLARYWATDHDWRKAEAKINALPNFITNIDGLDIHFIHVKSKEKNALPIIITHGWPG
ncbi:MAG: epoxide hydrolase N-terminal domain-containing protein, partial [Thermoanaerobaculia bacterium]